MVIYYEDNDIIVCEKPYGFSSQESSGENMVSALKTHTGCDVFCVHRLDIQTTGVMVYAKNIQSAGKLSEQIVNRKFVKRYKCICHGDCEGSGELVDILYHDKINNKSFVVDTKRKGAKEARLEFWNVGSCKAEGKCLTKLEILLHTGRTHQIRVQLASRGHTLYGDGKYGAKDNDKIALHSFKIEFNHPKTNKKMSFESEPKGEIWELFK
ncbi:MAG: RluA family pseudouridine synthase [Clostridia bacterium]|nr:RluA family pseudouridine synthase [Clostridia bacterium]